MRSLFSLLNFLGTGEYRKRYLGFKFQPTKSKITKWKGHALCVRVGPQSDWSRSGSVVLRSRVVPSRAA